MSLDATTYLGRSQHKTTGASRPPRYLTDTAEWVDKIYQLERADDTYTADFALGGNDGVSNLPHQALANRTAFLYRQNIAIIAYLNQLAGIVDTATSGIRPLVVSTAAASDPDAAWLRVPSALSSTSSDVTIALSNGTTLRNPTFDVTTDNGSSFTITTDGRSTALPDLARITDSDIKKMLEDAEEALNNGNA